MVGAERLLESLIRDELVDAGLDADPTQERALLAELAPLLRAFRRSALIGLGRPKSRLILINGVAGIYAQPDYWDGQHRFFEMKSYRAIPPRDAVRLQLELFQVAFPGFEAILVCYDRHAPVVEEERLTMEAMTPERTAELLDVAGRIVLEHGVERVLEYVDSPITGYNLTGFP